jgi:hypothetical protein
MKYCAVCDQYWYDSLVRCSRCGGFLLFGRAEQDWDDDDQQLLTDLYRMGMDYAELESEEEDDDAEGLREDA